MTLHIVAPPRAKLSIRRCCGARAEINVVACPKYESYKASVWCHTPGHALVVAGGSTPWQALKAATQKWNESHPRKRTGPTEEEKRAARERIYGPDGTGSHYIGPERPIPLEPGERLPWA